MGDFSEAASGGSYSASERRARGSLSFFRAKALPLQTPAPPKAEQLEGKESRAKEKDKGMFQDLRETERELFPLIRSCV